MIYTANVGEFTIRGTLEKIIKFAEAKGYEADREKDYRMMHFYWQIADHWKRYAKTV